MIYDISDLKDDDFCSGDEIKIYKDEGDDDDKEFSANEELQAALLEEKSSLILETEMAIKQECMARIDPGKFVLYILGPM